MAKWKSDSKTADRACQSGIQRAALYGMAVHTGEVGASCAGSAVYHFFTCDRKRALGSLTLVRLVSRQLFRVSTFDLLTFVLMTLMLLAVGLLATIIPAPRMTRVDPLEACRYE
jgi:hypothetical protein